MITTPRPPSVRPSPNAEPIPTPLGFRFAGGHAGIKAHKNDLALVASDVPCAAAGCFTTNLARAAPVIDCDSRLPGSGFRAVVVNSGNANALTGAVGMQDVESVKRALGAALHTKTEAILTASTGVIGHRLQAQKIVDAAPALVAALALAPDGAAQGILTTDTRAKIVARVVTLDGQRVTLTAIGKGAGMIHPALATMIVVIATDCAISPVMLDRALTQSMETSFHALTVDGDMSTNDSVFALANGEAKNAPIKSPSAAYETFARALAEVCEEMAQKIASDGEGASRLVTVKVTGTPKDVIARDLARAVAGSNLVKAAIFGADPNWGRVLSTIGARAATCGYDVDPAKADVRIQSIAVFRGEPLAVDTNLLRARMREPEVVIEVDLQSGDGQATAWGCDLSYDYVKINADYSSMIVSTDTGAVTKDDKLANYSPSFKASLLVEALAFVARFRGTRCVVKYGGAAMVKDSLKESFCDDIALLRALGLVPVVVHGGGPEISKALEKLGSASEFVDGVRITRTEDLKVVEMVLSGSINSDLVARMNRSRIWSALGASENHARAVGVSGKDGALLRAKKYVADHGRDLGRVGEVTSVNQDFLEMLLQKEYVPVVSPIGLGDDGEGFNINADAVAAEVAIAIGAKKLIYLTDVAGILDDLGELVSEMKSSELEAQLQTESIAGGMKAKGDAILKAIRAGVERVHVVDGRVPHSVVAELFTDRGVGTLITL
ncbi:MAG: bifunctional glutamate N-acetyltransferase/amino-acid acetyltransferase ArgJ [Polyangiaceae bacterium]